MTAPASVADADAANVAAAAPVADAAGFTLLTDIEYRPGGGGLSAQRFDLYLPASPTVRGVFVFLHGGGWRAGDKSTSTAIPTALARAGVITVNANYTLTGEKPYPRNVEDVFSVIETLVERHAEFGIPEDDARRVFLGGTSAGGHLSALAVTKGLAERRLAVVPAAVVSWYAPLDPPSRFLKHRYPAETHPDGFWARGRARRAAQPSPAGPVDPFVPFIGTEDFGQVTLRDALDGDPRLHLASIDPADLPPFLLLVGTRDSDEIRYAQSTLHGALRSVGAESTLLEIANLDHADDRFADPALIGAVIGTIRAATR
jgi:acetyl esterase/lipase